MVEENSIKNNEINKAKNLLTLMKNLHFPTSLDMAFAHSEEQLMCGIISGILGTLPMAGLLYSINPDIDAVGYLAFGGITAGSVGYFIPWVIEAYHSLDDIRNRALLRDYFTHFRWW